MLWPPRYVESRPRRRKADNRKPAKLLCNVCFWVTLVMSLSISSQISDSHFLLKKVGEKVKGGWRSRRWWTSSDHQMSCYITLNVVLQLKTNSQLCISITEKAEREMMYPRRRKVTVIHMLNHHNKYLFWISGLISIQRMKYDANNLPLKAQFVPAYVLRSRGGSPPLRMTSCLCLQSMYSR